MSAAASKASSKPSRAESHDELVASVRKIIDTDLRPYVQADGGDIELVSVDGDKVRVRLTGACTTCPSSPSTLREGVEARLRAMISDDLRVEEAK